MIIAYPPVHSQVSASEGKVYADCANHCRQWKYYSVRGSKTSSTHEITHGINSEARNKQGVAYHTNFVRNMASLNEDSDGNTGISPVLPVRQEVKPPAWLKEPAAQAGPKVNCLYIRDNRLMVVNEPPIRKRDVAPFVPTPLRGSRYKLYVEGQLSWDDTPLYLWDEWVAYMNGAAAASNQPKAEQGRDVLMGVLEFVVYGTAVMMATAAQSSVSHEELIPDFKVLMRESLQIYYQNAAAFPFPGQDRYFEAWRTGKSGEPLRDYYFSIGLTGLDSGKRPRHVIL